MKVLLIESNLRFYSMFYLPLLYLHVLTKQSSLSENIFLTLVCSRLPDKLQVGNAWSQNDIHPAGTPLGKMLHCFHQNLTIMEKCPNVFR